MDEESFSIEDNCGGIPRTIAINYAFKMGREADDTRDSETETIGMYSVGMKRAIFKMGLSAKVRTLFNDDAFEVDITPDWLSEKEWKPLPIEDSIAADRLSEPGTRITVEELYTGVTRHFINPGFLTICAIPFPSISRCFCSVVSE